MGNGILKQLGRWVGIGVGVIGLPLLIAAQPYGLNQRAPIGAFLSNRLPPGAPQETGSWTTVPAFPNLTFKDPVFLTPVPRANRLAVCGMQGVIYTFDNDPNTTNKTAFLDIQSRTQGGIDSGIMSVAFHPEFGLAGSTNRGNFYVWYQFSLAPVPNPSSNQVPSFNRLSRFTVADGSSAADPNSELALMQQYDQSLWHNGGTIFFGEDGFLYLANGDEGGSNDQYNNSQKLTSGFFGGVFRIDVNQDPTKSHPIRRQPSSGGPGLPSSFSANYYIPNDNPFLDPGGGLLEEFYALGFRNPFSMSLDPVTKQIWLADVGQENREEVNLLVKGGNYQWAYREGTRVGPKAKPPAVFGTEKPPLYEYIHTNGNQCIIGGRRYRGSVHASALSAKYIFGDNISGRIWAMAYDGTNAPVVEFLCNMPAGVVAYEGLTGICADQNGELFLCRMGTGIQLRRLAMTSMVNPAPLLLSQTGAFTNLNTLAPTNGLIPYNVNSPLWSDYGQKQRWIGLPNDGAPFATNELISFSPTGEWHFPSGTVFVKHFAIATNEAMPNQLKRLETRFLVRNTNGGVYGLTYKWRSDTNEADLLPGSFSETIYIQTGSGVRTQVWYYPSRQDCLTCHNPTTSFVLGVNTRQLNGTFLYPATGQSDNQIRTLNHIECFTPAVNEAAIPTYAQLVAVTNSLATISHRVRSYLDANCAFCHRPGSNPAFFDARFDTPLAQQNIINGPVRTPLEITNAVEIAPGDVARSMMHRRMNTVDQFKMPPLARNEIDKDAVAALIAWINSLTNTPQLEIQRNLSEYSLLFHGEPGVNYTLEGTTNLSTWNFISTVQDGGIRSITSDVTNLPHRVYRLRTEP